ncbi:hypothetical protein QC760_010320 [Botrytis cinerea]
MANEEIRQDSEQYREVIEYRSLCRRRLRETKRRSHVWCSTSEQILWGKSMIVPVSNDSSSPLDLETRGGGVIRWYCGDERSIAMPLPYPQISLHLKSLPSNHYQN